MSYKIIEHRADLKIRVVAKNKEELFREAMKAMIDYLSPETKKEKVEREIVVDSLDLPTLLVDFLNEILYLCQVEKEAYFKINFKNFRENSLKAVLEGNKVKAFQREIKAVTYHNLEIKDEKGNLATEILFDI